MTAQAEPHVIDLLPNAQAFSKATYGRIYGAMQALRARGGGIDPEALQETLRRNPEWDGDLDLLYRLGGGIARADDYAASTELCLTYARKLADLHARRQDKKALLRFDSLPGDPNGAPASWRRSWKRRRRGRPNGRRRRGGTLPGTNGRRSARSPAYGHSPPGHLVAGRPAAPGNAGYCRTPQHRQIRPGPKPGRADPAP